MSESCKNCRSWGDNNGTDTGQCRRHPPRIVDAFLKENAERAIRAATAFPETDHDQWCGEWQPQPEARP